jgi:hypothetical protein
LSALERRPACNRKVRPASGKALKEPTVGGVAGPKMVAGKPPLAMA